MDQSGVGKEPDLKFRLRVVSAVLDKLELRHRRRLRLDRPRIVRVVGDQTDDGVRSEDTQSLAQESRAHQAPPLMTALWPGIREEDVQIVGAPIGQLA